MRRHLAACAGSAMVFSVAFGGVSAPAWAEPEPGPRPAVDSGRHNSGSEPAERDSAKPASPPVADSGRARVRRAEVEPLGEIRSREYFAVLPGTVPARTLAEVRRIDGVEAVEVVDAARVRVDGETTSVLGVDASSFRGFAPEPSARSDEIWQGVAGGGIALSKEVGEQRRLELGHDVEVAGGKGMVELPVWTHATSGVAGIDALVSREVAAELGFPEGNGLVISAPDADLWDLRDRLEEVLGEDAGLQVLAEEPEDRPFDAEGDPVPGTVVERMIAAAESKLGTPYVWGDEGPDSFDCSGLVQWAFAQAGVAVPRVTHDQWWAGEHVDYADARRGDLIFWRTDPTAPDYISHVAIYLGDGMMIEAPRSGDVVKVTEVRMEKMAGLVRVHV
ncbi:C40 family peptidase [Marinactinospora thermotolerans]|uniref:Cell wall-associated hydrolases (Invasion-associated proteins) n=1 Tax=Marinactinospora thermotolerans DSM 45154 TaxID=1122192 RepID=A0A1T4RPG7_9ACTN|nr:C40 family peptidase [Marinactinospora thermotolerans]SKA17561.1 Cell wall-associated hydrolases (invasion-associated proteins) [Marinactinospora thermotolerans DSM 45154]